MSEDAGGVSDVPFTETRPKAVKSVQQTRSDTQSGAYKSNNWRAKVVVAPKEAKLPTTRSDTQSGAYKPNNWKAKVVVASKEAKLPTTRSDFRSGAYNANKRMFNGGVSHAIASRITNSGGQTL